jgi:hypothetical protein
MLGGAMPLLEMLQLRGCSPSDASRVNLSSNCSSHLSGTIVNDERGLRSAGLAPCTPCNAARERKSNREVCVVGGRLGRAEGENFVESGCGHVSWGGDGDGSRGFG